MKEKITKIFKEVMSNMEKESDDKFKFSKTKKETA